MYLVLQFLGFFTTINLWWRERTSFHHFRIWVFQGRPLHFKEISHVSLLLLLPGFLLQLIILFSFCELVLRCFSAFRLVLCRLCWLYLLMPAPSSLLLEQGLSGACAWYPGRRGSGNKPLGCFDMSTSKLLLFFKRCPLPSCSIFEVIK